MQGMMMMMMMMNSDDHLFLFIYSLIVTSTEELGSILETFSFSINSSAIFIYTCNKIICLFKVSQSSKYAL